MLRLLCFLVLLTATANPQIAKNEYTARRLRAMDVFKDGLLLVQANASVSLSEPGFQQYPDFQYFTGLENTPSAVLVIDGAKEESWLFVPRKLSGIVGLAFAQRPAPTPNNTGIEHVSDWEELVTFLDQRLKGNSVPRVYIAENHWQGAEEVPVAMDKHAAHGRLWSNISQRWPTANVVSTAKQLDELRGALSPAEIAISRRVGKTSAKALIAGMRSIKPNVTQRVVEGEIARECFRSGADGVSFWPWAMSGPNAVFPKPFETFVDYRSLNREMKAGELVRVDVGCAVDHYRGDVGRTVPVMGHYTDEQREAWNVFTAAYRTGLAVIKNGTRPEEVFATWQAEARRRQTAVKTPLAKALVEQMLSKTGSQYWQIHGVGLVETNPPPVLRSGMTLAFEPMSSVGDQGFYLEDTILITDDGYENLTPGLPYTAEEIETLMSGK